MRSLRRRAVAAVLLCLSLVAAACGDDDDDDLGTEPAGTTTTTEQERPVITVGSADFSESVILASMFSQALAAEGFDINEKFRIGAREIYFAALERGEIDLVPEYIGTALSFLKGTPTTDVAETTGLLRTALAAKDLVALEPSQAADQNAFAVTQETATKYNLKTMSDLRAVAAQLVFGAGPECPTRPACLIGLRETYGLRFKDVKTLDSGGPLTKDALQNGDIQVGLVFSSDGAIVARNFVVLEDDKKLQPVDNIVPVLRQDKATEEVETILNDIMAQLTTADLADLNKRADVDKDDPEVLAADWLEEHGFLN